MKSLNTLLAVTALAGIVATTEVSAQRLGDSVPAKVSRGDADRSGTLDQADIRTMLGILFSGHQPAVSLRDLDVNRDGRFDISDVDALSRILAETSGGSKPAEVRTEPAVLGDANDDGKVDIADVIALTEYLLGGKQTKAPKEASDVNRDGKVDITDLSLLHLAV